MFDAEKLRALNFAMIDYYTGMPKYIQHFEKVHAFSSMIAQEEGLDEDTRFILEAAALVHDIGIKPSKEKYGSSAGQYQQIEGPAPAGEMMKKLGFSGDVIARVQYLVAHHHTYTNIDGADYRILVEADFLVNAYEDNMSEAAIRTAAEKIFETESGKKLLNDLFLGEKYNV